MSREDWKWLTGWGRKLGAACYLLFLLAFLNSHPRPGSMDSVVYATTSALLPAISGTALSLAVLLYIRKH